jgi:NAD(P)H-nitrite reductase large subunit
LGDDKATAFKLSNGQETKADLLIVDVGVRPNISAR